MVKFLIKRPIAVSMTFLALIILGMLTSLQLPISLLPNINIPKISIQASLKNSTTQEVENSLIKPLRRSLLQLAHLKTIKSTSRASSGIIQLDFDYGTNINYAFIEVNEKIDRTLTQLPKDAQRPRVIKASASDIPVFYLNLSLKNANTDNKNNSIYNTSPQIIDLSNFSNQVIKKRIEQLPEVAMVDISGLVSTEIMIIPDMQKMRSLNISLSELENIIKNNNIKLGNLLIHDGQYQYNIRFTNNINNKSDIENIYFKKGNNLLQIKQIVKVIEHPQKQKGTIVSDGKTAISMAIIKQSDSKIQDVETALKQLTTSLIKDYPNIKFTVTRDQTKLLKYSINNLLQSLLLGSFLAFIIMFLFLKDIKSPILIGISIPVSLTITLLLFYISGVSINIISLSGLILGVGMMIDNSIIVIDNINQHRERGEELSLSSINGTNEIFRPLLSSILTTIAVYIPLIFISGISGALFYEQAIAISIGLFVSLIVSITLIPTYYTLFYKKNQNKKSIKFFNKINYSIYYEKGFNWIMRHQAICLSIIILIILLTFILFNSLNKQQLPEFKTNETMLHIDWNEHINTNENQKRVIRLFEEQKNRLFQSTGYIGEQQFLLNLENKNSTSEATIYCNAKSNNDLKELIINYKQYLKNKYPKAHYEFSKADNIFNIIFNKNNASLVAHFRPSQSNIEINKKNLYELIKQLHKQIPDCHIPLPETEEQIVLETNPAKLKLYNIEYSELYNKIKTVFNEHYILSITQNNKFTPVVIGSNVKNIKQIIAQTLIRNTSNDLIPLSKLVTIKNSSELKFINAGQEGIYYPINFNIKDNEELMVKRKIEKVLKQNKNFSVYYTGSINENRQLIKQISIVLLVTILLLFLILATQFESLSIPLIVLIEIPIDLFGAFLMLYLFNSSINLMSLIGIIVMSGIIINDSILKIDTIIQLRKQGYSLLRAMIEAGHRRLKPIIMTSLTTILALLPFLFTTGLGAELQKPLALTIIGGMIIGTIVSLYFIPLLFYYLKKKKY